MFGGGQAIVLVSKFEILVHLSIQIASVCWIYPGRIQAELAPAQDTSTNYGQTVDDGQTVGFHMLAAM